MAGRKSSGNRDSRIRNWAAVIYPESAPENWQEILDSSHLEWVESPLHEFDTNPTGEIKKAHYHIVLMFSGVKTYEQVCEFLEPLNCPAPQRCHSAKGAVRYMAHLDNPEKFQYNISDIKPHGGVDIAELLRANSSDRYVMIREMCCFIQDENISEFQDLMDYAMMERPDTWFPLLCDNSAYVVGLYIKSKRHRNAQASSPDAGA